MAKKWLTIDDPGATEGLEKKDPPSWVQPDTYHECPKCHGYGVWIGIPNAFGEGRHQKVCCFDCRGWGHVRKSEHSQCVLSFCY